nr:nucleolar protein dao-5-like [Aegilops tauschii subsp. strangulata]
MSDASDSQNKSEEEVNLSEGTSPSGRYDEGSRSTSSNLPKAATRQRKKRTSESEDEEFVVEEEVTSKKKVLKKEYNTASAIKTCLHKKAPAKRVPMSKARRSTVPQEPMEFTLEPREEQEPADGKKKRKERVKKTIARVISKPSMMVDDEDDDEEEPAAPPAKSQKLMANAMKSAGAPSKSKPKPAPKVVAPKRSTRNIPAAEKNKAPMLEVREGEEPQVLRKLKPKIPDHDDGHPVAENMKPRKDSGLREWRKVYPYSARRISCDYRFNTREQQDFYETVLLDKKPIISNMKWVDWKYIDAMKTTSPMSMRVSG